MTKSHKPTREQLLASAENLVKEHGENLTFLTYIRHTGYPERRIYEIFGCWANLRMAIGLPPHAHSGRKKISTEQILADARKLALQHGDCLTAKLFCSLTGCTLNIIYSRFGGWGELRRQVGLSPRAVKKPVISREEIIEDLLRVYRVTGSRPSYTSHVARGGRISVHTIRYYFGSWIEALLELKKHLRQITPPDQQGHFRTFNDQFNYQFFELHRHLPPLPYSPEANDDEWKLAAAEPQTDRPQLPTRSLSK